MKNLALLVFIALLNNSFGQLAQWTHSNGKGWFIETERKAANNQPIWQESGQFNYEELSRTESEVLLKDINGRSDMQVKITSNTCYWKYPNDANWNILYSGSWTVKPILFSYKLAQWTHSDGKGWFIETERKAANNQPIWQESGQFNYEELSRTESEVLLKDINGRSDMQVKITNNACFWKYPNDVNWNTLQSGSWTVRPILKIEENCTSSRSKYLEQNPDVKKAGLDPWGHYQSYGKKEGRKWPNCNVDFYEVTIGSKIWMNKNLNVDKFRNGDPIPEAKTNEEWQRANSNQQPAWCYYNNDPKNGEKYGKLYNWYAVNDPRGLAPLGWKVASDEDWKNLIANYSGNTNAGSKLKSSNGAAFQGELGGFRNGTGPFVDLGIFGDFWTSLSTDSYNAVYYKIGANSNAIDRSTNDKPGGLSVRCVKEMNSVSTNNVSSSNYVSQAVTTTNSTPQTTNTTSQGATASSSSSKPVSNTVPTPTFKTVQIGTQTWMAENLNVDRFRNGDPIPEVKTGNEWEKAEENKQPAWCYYNNDPVNGAKYGKLYNWYAVTDPRGLAPQGFHVPSKEEWKQLIYLFKEKSQLGAFLVGDESKLKSDFGWLNWQTGGEIIPCPNCASWNDEYRKKVACHVCKDSRDSGKRKPIIQHSGNGKNTSGFCALPGGKVWTNCASYGCSLKFSYLGTHGYWWSSTFENPDYGGHAFGYDMVNTREHVILENIFNSYGEDVGNGLSIRCLKD